MKCTCVFLIIVNVCDLSNGDILVANVKGCKVIGRKDVTILEDKLFAVFWHIPYAEPPIQKLRFKAPKAKFWHNGTYDYSNPRRNMCTCCYNEDCLYLSVYMPISSNQTWNLPVVVWLNNSPELYSPDFFLEEDVVVVTVAHRQSIFGFLNTGDDFAEGNMGSKDVLIALKWIKGHISSFYGDPNKITVIGSKSSAVIVSSLVLTPAAKGLFSRVIILSYSALSPAYYRQYNFDAMNKLFWNLNGPFDKFNRTKLYEILGNYSTNEIILATENIFDSTEVRDNQRLIKAFGPSIETSEEAFMNKFPIDVYKEHLANNNVDVMIGYTSLESLYKLKGFAKNKELLKYLNYNFQYLLPFEGTQDEYGSNRYRKIKQKIMEFYFVNGTIGERSLRRYAKYVSDQEIYPLLRQARLHAGVSSKNVYLYRFAYKGAFNVAWDSSVRNLNWSGATSGDEICYLFRCKSVNDIYKSAKASAERHFIKKIARLLANFAKYGNPTPAEKDDILENLIWEPLTSGRALRAMILKQKFKMVDAPEEIRMNFWDQLRSKFFPEKLSKDEL